MNRLVEEYFNQVSNLFNDMTMILYGSTVFGINSSDLDVCFIREEDLSKNQFKLLIELTREFHINNNLRIDEEIPYENKLIYTNHFIENSLKNLPFPFVNDKYIVPPIEKTKIFLNSEEMKKRLLLNILTVKHMVFGSGVDLIEHYRQIAWEEMVKVVISYSESRCFSLQELLNYFYNDPFTKMSGELYLGYKNNLEEKNIYLEEELKKQLAKLESEDKLEKKLKKKYVPRKDWLKR